MASSLAPQVPDYRSDDESSSVRTRRVREDQRRRLSLPASGEVVPASSSEPPTFRVYTPDEMRRAPLRASDRPSPTRGRGDDRKTYAEATGPRAMLKWIGIGIAFGGFLLTAFVVLLSVVDDTQSTAGRSRASMTSAPDDRGNTPSFMLKPTTPSANGSPGDSNPAPDFELPDDTTTAGRAVAKPHASVKVKPRAMIRDAPY